MGGIVLSKGRKAGTRRKRSPSAPSVPERYTRGPCRLNGVVVDLDAFGCPENFFDRNRDDVRRLQCDHLVPFLIGDRANRGSSKPHGEKPVIPGWLTAPLKMSEHERATLLFRTLFDLI